MTQEALKLALEALKFALHVGFPESSESQIKKGEKAYQQHRAAITAIKEALAQTQEPVAWRWENRGEDNWLKKYIYLDNGAPDYPEECTPLYTTPPQRTWVDLTDEEIDNINYTSAHMLAREVLAKFKEKNT